MNVLKDRRRRPFSPPLRVAVALLAAASAGGMLAAPAAASARARQSEPARRAFTWGSNFYGQLGVGASCQHGTFCTATSPQPVVGPGRGARLLPVLALSAGSTHSLAAVTGGRVWAWGSDSQGELGDGTNVPERTRPVYVLGPNRKSELTDVTAVSGGNAHSLALARDGQAWAWGSNIWGQLGIGRSNGPDHCVVGVRKPSPADVCSKVALSVVGPDGTGRQSQVTAVAAGVVHSVALRADGTVWAWGANDVGQLGIGNSTGPKDCKPFASYEAIGCSPEPVQVVGPGGKGHLTHIVAIAAGDDYSLAVRADGTLWAWGSDLSGALGQPESWKPEACQTPFGYQPVPCSTVPVEVASPDGKGHLRYITSVSANPSTYGGHVLALRAGGTVWAWGTDDYGQLGDGMTQPLSRLPGQVLGPGGKGQLTRVTAIAAGGHFSLALRVDGSVWAWGQNNLGQLGIGTRSGPEHCAGDVLACSTVPIRVTGPGGKGSLDDITAIAAGQLHSMALRRAYLG